MKPSIGRIVHYVNLGDKDGKYPPESQAAIITGVVSHETDTGGGAPFVSLTIFYRTGIFTMDRVPWSEKPERGHWSWPPLV